MAHFKTFNTSEFIDLLYFSYSVAIFDFILSPFFISTECRIHQFSIPFENNTRRIEILEEMARMLYREWFVKFRFPVDDADGNDGDRLFNPPFNTEKNNQVELVESELGLIPKGWKVVTLGEVVDIGRGSSPRPIKDQKYFEGGTIPWIKIADATKSGKYLYETKQKVNKYGASFSRLMPKGSLILAASGTLGYTQLLGVEGCIHDGWLYIENFKGINKHYLYFLFKDHEQFFYNSAYGAAIQNINTQILREMKVVLPPLEIQDKFFNLIDSNDKLIDNLGCKNINLRKTRDLLLPRLISGEIDVEDLDINTGNHEHQN
jgi:type I restriction enzyme S subunit